MRALWGNLSICPILDHVDLPYHTVGELLSISCLKVWGDTQMPQDSKAYLLVKVEDASEVKGYGMAWYGSVLTRPRHLQWQRH